MNFLSICCLCSRFCPLRNFCLLFFLSLYVNLKHLIFVYIEYFLMLYSIDVVSTLSYFLVYTEEEHYILFKTTWTYSCLINNWHFAVVFCGSMLLVETLFIMNATKPLFRPGRPNENNSLLVQIMALFWIYDNLQSDSTMGQFTDALWRLKTTVDNLILRNICLLSFSRNPRRMLIFNRSWIWWISINDMIFVSIYMRGYWISNPHWFVVSFVLMFCIQF